MITGIIEQKHSSHFIESNTSTIKVYTVYIYYYHVISMSKPCSCSMWMGTIKPGGHPRRPVLVNTEPHKSVNPEYEPKCMVAAYIL